MPNNPSKKQALRPRADAPERRSSPVPKSAITASKAQQDVEHLTRQIVHQIVDGKIEKLLDRETAQNLVANGTSNLTDSLAVHKLITARTEHLMERSTVHRLFSEHLAQLVDRDTVYKIVTERLSMQLPQTSQRPALWEDDISANTLDESPFEKLSAPSSREVELFVEAAATHGDRETLAKVNIREMVVKDDIPIPTPTDREGYFPGFDEKYWLFGLADYLKVMETAAKYKVQPKSVLDFGCASGRVLRHFAAQTEIKNIWGSDINRRHIRWLYEHMPMHVRPVFNHCIPSLPIADGSIDVITAFSVFTHIDTFEIHWLAELSRILSDDGLCYLTVHNEDTWEALAGDENNPNNRLLQSLIGIDPEVVNQLQHPMPDDRLVYRFADQGPYRAQVFLSNRHLETVWGRFFSIEEIIPRHHQRQTVVVLKKRR